MKNSLQDTQIDKKQDAILEDTLIAKKKYDLEKSNLDSFDPLDFDDEIPEINELRHELKLVIQLINQANFDEIIHLISNPARFLGLNLVIGFVRGLGFCMAILIMAIVVAITMADTSLFSF